MMDLLHEHIEKGYCIVFIDDMLIFSCSEADHDTLAHVKAVLDTLRKANWRLSESKCLFGKSQATFLGFDVVSVTPNEALPHIGRQPWRNAKDDRCNLPALL